MGSDPMPLASPNRGTGGLGSDPTHSAARCVELAGEVLELAAQLLVLEDLVEGRRLELLQRLEGGGRVLHEASQLEARLHRLEGVVGDPQVMRGALAGAGHLLALLQEIAPVALGSLLGEDDIVRGDDIYQRAPEETK